MAITLDGTTGVTASAFAGDGSSLTDVPVFVPTTTSGATQALDVGSFNFFDAGTLTADTTVSFTNVPTEARWTYTAEAGLASDAWDISTASFVRNFSVTAQDGGPKGLFFKPDGTAMYFVGSLGDAVYQYSLSSAWNISTASYVRSFSVAAQETAPIGIFFKPDGTVMYVVGPVGDDVNEYSLSTAWDISTASYVRNFSVAAQDTTAYGLFFKPDGTAMYFAGATGDSVYEYSLSTAWNISTASYVRNFSVAAQETVPISLFFKDDGTTMYVVGQVGDDVNEYSLSTAWNISTASYVQSFSVAAQGYTDPVGIFFKPDGTVMYITDDTVDEVAQYSLATPYSITTPASVQNPPSASYLVGEQVSYTFYTLDGGTTVNLINEEVL